MTVDLDITIKLGRETGALNAHAVGMDRGEAARLLRLFADQLDPPSPPFSAEEWARRVELGLGTAISDKPETPTERLAREGRIQS